jgi:hypothetical protein
MVLERQFPLPDEPKIISCKCFCYRKPNLKKKNQAMRNKLGKAMLIRAVYIVSRTGLLLVDRVYGETDHAPDSIMVSSFFTALLTFSNESVKKLAEALDKTAIGIVGAQIDAFTYGNLRFLFYEQEQIFLVLVIPRAAELETIKPLGEKILEKFLNTYDVSLAALANPDMTTFENFRTEIDRILVQDINLNPVKIEIELFKQLLELP